jgi:hypothetical protein
VGGDSAWEQDSAETWKRLENRAAYHLVEAKSGYRGIRLPLSWMLSIPIAYFIRS